MPDPLAMPLMRTVFPPMRPSTAIDFSRVSVVMMARAAAPPPCEFSAETAEEIPFSSFGHGKKTSDHAGARHQNLGRFDIELGCQALRAEHRIVHPSFSRAGIGASGVDQNSAHAPARKFQVFLAQNDRRSLNAVERKNSRSRGRL